MRRSAPREPAGVRESVSPFCSLPVRSDAGCCTVGARLLWRCLAIDERFQIDECCEKSGAFWLKLASQPGRGFMGTPAKTQPRASSSSRTSPEERPICSFGELDPQPVRNHCEATRPFWSLSAPHRRRIQPRVVIWQHLHRWNGRAARNRRLRASWSRAEQLVRALSDARRG